MNYQKKIRMLRAYHKWSVQHLADQVGVTEGTVRHYENGLRKPDMVMMGKLADALGSDVNTLFYDQTEALFPFKQ